MLAKTSLKIAFVGNFAYKKGSRVFAEVVKALGSRHKWYIFGYVGDKDSYKDIASQLSAVQAYDGGELPLLLKKHQIDLVLILSIWPETFSKTTFEVAAEGVPFLSFDVGYPATFFKRYPLSVPLKSGAVGVVRELEKLDKAELAKLQQYIKKSFDLSKYQKKAELKYSLIDQLV